jgi:hypothetical protein
MLLLATTSQTCSHSGDSIQAVDASEGSHAVRHSVNMPERADWAVGVSFSCFRHVVRCRGPGRSLERKRRRYRKHNVPRLSPICLVTGLTTLFTIAETTTSHRVASCIITQYRSLQLSNVPVSCRYPEKHVHAMRGINSIDPVPRDAGCSQSPGNGVYAAGWRT